MSARTVLARPGVGAAGHIIQRSGLTSRRIRVDAATLILVEEGRKRIRFRGGDCVANPGDAIALQAGEVVDISNTPGRSGAYRALWICFEGHLLDGDEVATSVGSSPRVALQARLGDAFRASYRRAFESLSDAEALPPAIATHRLREVLLWLAARRFRFLPPAPPSLGQRVRRLLAADPSIEWSMEHVAHETATSIATLRRRLTAEKIVFRDLLQEVRMSHALALLQNTDTPVLQIALATGYASPSRFTARFRARFGFLPTDVRGQKRNRRSTS